MDIFVQKHGQQTGPFDEAAARSRLSSGELASSDMAWAEGSASWIPLETFLANAASQARDRRSSPAPSPAFDKQPVNPLDADPSKVFDMHDAENSGIGKAVKSVASEFQSLEYASLLPVGTMFTGAVLRKKAVRWVIFFGLMPLLVLVLKNAFEWTFEQSAWLFGAYFCFFWALYFHGILEPTGNVWRRGLKWAAFTVLIGIPVLLVAQHLPVIRNFYARANSGFADTSFIYRCLGFIFVVGVLEESCKALPLLLFALRKNENLSKRNGMFLGMMSGFGFAVSEVVTYSVRYWNASAQVSAVVFADSIQKSTNWLGLVDSDALAQRMNNNLPALVEFYGNMVLSQIVRFMTLPLLHAIWTGVVGWFIAVACQRRKSRWPVVVVGIFVIAVVHGLYDTFSSSLIGVGIAGATILFFMAYLVHGEEAPATAEPNSSVTQ